MSKPTKGTQKRRKDPKRVREAKRIQHANSYKEGFDAGFKLGLQVASNLTYEPNRI